MNFAGDFLVLELNPYQKKDFKANFCNFRSCQLIICFKCKKIYLPVAEFLNSKFPLVFFCTGASLHTEFTLNLPHPT